jgi:hypothetical protein
MLPWQVLLAQFTVPTDWFGDWCGMVCVNAAAGISKAARTNRYLFIQFKVFAVMA